MKKSNKKIINAGVIGVGYLGKFHAQKYASLDDVNLVGVVDLDTVLGRQVADECSCKYFIDYKQILKEVDVVSIVVPTSYHHEVALDCIEAGVDILLEKPMTVTLDEADDLIKRSATNNLVLQVGHLERFNPVVQAMKPLLTEPIFIESERISCFKNRGTDVDVVLDLMIHDIDIILNIVNSPLKTIHSMGAPVVTQTTDLANVRLVFENGATASLTVSRISSQNSRKMKVYQPGSYINVDFANRKVMTMKLTGELRESGMPIRDVEVKSFPTHDALNEEIKHFIDCVKKRKTPIVSGKEGRNALDIALKVIEQINKQQELELFKNVNLFSKTVS